MDRLPYELVTNIFEHITKTEIKSLRLACRSWADVGAPHLFPRIWLSSHPLDVQVFRRVIKNPLICSGVRELIWDDTTYCDSLMDREKYMTSAENVGSWGYWSTEYYAEHEVEEGYRLFLENARLHHYIRRRRIDQRLLVDSLPRFENLKSVVLSSRHHYRPFPDADGDIVKSPTARQWKLDPAIETMGYPPTVNWKTIVVPGDDSEPTSKELKQMMDVDFHKDVWDEDRPVSASCVQILRPFRGLLILLRALETTGKQIERFEIRPQYQSKWGRDNDMVGISHCFFREPSIELDRFTTIVRQLRKLHLVVSCEGSARADHHASAVATMKRGNFTRVLQSTERLEELHLELPMPHVLKAIGYDTHLSRLRSLSLMQGNVEPLELLDFLKRHRKTLQSLTLSHCNSTTESWETLLDRMKSESLYLPYIDGYFLLEPDQKNWCSILDQPEIDRFFAGEAVLPMISTPWRGAWDRGEFAPSRF